jgi:uncharacterized membrane protein YidH (DUF202 family)
MWFQALSFVIAAALLVKASIALTIPHRFYASRQRHYASTSLPPELMVPPAVILCVTSVAWYATLFHYRPWGWLVTGPLTLLCCLSLHNLVRWRQHRHAMSRVVAHPRVWVVDCLLLVLGAGFAALGLFVYGD